MLLYLFNSLDIKNLYKNLYSYKSETYNSIYLNVVYFTNRSTKTMGKKNNFNVPFIFSVVANGDITRGSRLIIMDKEKER